ncbi:serine/threonine protein kinase [Thauera propionica]|uniref:serine/threonine protein kinase n=1 Tax=Thauera propionica TaxID=2019431 RepID=UPI0023EFE2C4|nr:serine/threonine protein kinase [Thauera propionica]MDD3675747.1 HDOD domain-containing protein [Thauera propionica]
MTSKIGRFEIRRELGRGAQSIVYLAWDPQLEREVAVKTLHFSATEKRDNAALLAEARAVSRLRHPGIVPVFEAGEEDSDVYLVFEYVPGDNLGTHIQQRGALPAADAARLCIDILTALSTAHAEGIVHRDLKPSNVLIDVDGTPRVMDFGIAQRIDADTAGTKLSGTPGYMAPEYIRSRQVAPSNDVFAAGVLLVEMITGRRVMRERDPQRALQSAATVPVTLPKDAPEVDEALAAIALRAAALDPAARFQSAEDFRIALEAWLNPKDATTTPSGSGAVDFLLRRMRHRGDFPALSESVAAINRIASSDAENIDTLSNLVLRDFSLTNKLLRLVNSVHYRPASGRISTVSRALVVLGFDTVRNIAITVLLFEHLQNKSHAAQLREEFLRACLAGLFARDLAKHMNTRDLEQAYICSVFHNLGRLLCQYYFPEESEDIRRVMTQHGYREDVAAQRVLGVSFEELGIGLARSWGFPPVILESMRKLPASPVRRPATPEDRLRTLSAVANEYCDAVAHLSPAERDKAMKAIASRFADAVPVELKAVREVMQGAVQEIENFAQIIKLNLRQTRIGRNLATFDSEETLIHPHTTTETQMPSGAVLEQKSVAEAALAGEKPADSQAVLSSGIQDISNTLVEDFKLNDVLRIILETMYRAMGFKRVLLCVRDARSNDMTGRFGFGPGANELARHLRFSLSAHPDNVFNVATAKGVDILIEDIDEAKIAPRIPDWYRRSVPSRTFVLFPLMIKGRPVAMIYADKDDAGEIEISEQELALLRTLRNQAVLAIKQAG